MHRVASICAAALLTLAAGIAGAQSYPARAIRVIIPFAPGDVVHTLSSAMSMVLQMPEIRQRLIDLGFDPIGSTPDECAGNIRAEIAKWARVVKEAGIRLQ